MAFTKTCYGSFRISVVPVILQIVLALILTSCPSSPSGPPNPKPPGDKYTIEFRGGTTNIDSSFFSLSNLNPRNNSLEYQNNYLTQTAKILSKYGVLISPQVTKAVGVNFFVSVLKDGKPLTESTSLRFSSSLGIYSDPYELKANEAWNVFFPLAPKGNGTYGVVAKNGNKTLTANTSIALKSPNLLPAVQNIRVNAGGKALIATWDAVEGAKSYIVLGYDYSQEQYIWNGVTKTPSIYGSNLTEPKENNIQISVFALSWDITQPANQPLNPIPTWFDVSVASKSSYYYSEWPRSEVTEKYIGLSLEPENTSPISISIRNIDDSPIIFTANLHGDSAIKLTLPSSGSIFRRESTTLEIEVTCPNHEILLESKLTLLTNEIETPERTIPINVECVNPISVKRLYRKTFNGNISALAFDSNTAKLAISTTGEERALHIFNPMTNETMTNLTDIDIGTLTWQKGTDSIYGITLRQFPLASLKIWSGTTGENINTITPEGFGVNSFSAFDGNGSKLAYSYDTNDGYWATLDLLTNQYSLFTRDTPFYGASWNKSSDQIALQNGTGIYVYDGVTKQKMQFYQNPNSYLGGSLHWISDNRFLVNEDSHGYGSIRTFIIDKTSGKAIMNFPKSINEYFPVIQPSPSHTRVALALSLEGNEGLAKEVRVSSTISGNVLAKIPSPSITRVYSIAWNNNGTLLALGYVGVNGSILEIWEIVDDVN